VSDQSSEPLGSEATKAKRKVSVVDAVCCVYFCAAAKSSLLIAILTALDMEILIPEEVVTEAGQKSFENLATHLARLKASARVKILPRLMLEDERTDVLANVARVRGMSQALAISSRKDLGEAVVIGHAKHLADSGHDVYVLIDDQGAGRRVPGLRTPVGCRSRRFRSHRVDARRLGRPDRSRYRGRPRVR